MLENLQACHLQSPQLISRTACNDLKKFSKYTFWLISEDMELIIAKDMPNLWIIRKNITVKKG